MAIRKNNKAVDLASQADPRAPLDNALLLSRAQTLLTDLETDLLARARASLPVREALRLRHEAERAARRTADPLEVWERHFVTQLAASWLLSCVFVRTLEDRGLLGHNRIAGPGAADSQRLFFELAPSLTEREYLLTVFRELTRLPAARDLFDARHNPVWLLGPSADMAKKLVALFRSPSTETPGLRFGQTDTRFLGDLYQDLSADVRERFALLQTPHFIEKYILDRTLERAVARFGLDETTIIDPTCGSGHFLLGAFDRLVDHRLRKEPGLDVREGARRALDAVYGADINPYAVAIARFRLTLAFLDKGGYARLADAPALPLHLVVADSLLHNPQQPQTKLGEVAGQSMKAWGGEEFALEDEEAARDVLDRRFAAVVGNPPYITVKDAVLRERYREGYPKSAGGKYSVAAPFTERFFLLARSGGLVGMITANSFMKREFGKKLIEEFLKKEVNLDGVVNTSGAYIPGHGTPTVLLFGTNEARQGDDVLTVLAKRGEPNTPEDPEHGLVWRSIADHGGEVGFENDYISVARVPRATLEKHPWPLAGGGAVELKELLEERGSSSLRDVVSDVGFASFSGEDEAFIVPAGTFARLRVSADLIRTLVKGEDIRDWSLAFDEEALAPYDLVRHEPVQPSGPGELEHFWKYRSLLSGTRSFGGKTKTDGGTHWWEWYRWIPARYAGAAPIAYAYVATHGHFVRGAARQVFRGGASVAIIKLKAGATEEDHFALLAYLNSSTACFWMKQVCHNKTNASQKHTTDPARAAYEFAGTAMESLPVPRLDAPLFAQLAAALLEAGARRAEWMSGRLLRGQSSAWSSVDALSSAIGKGWKEYDQATSRAVCLQEELDWSVYQAFGLTTAQVSSAMLSSEWYCELGGRPFEDAVGYLDGVSDRARVSAPSVRDAARAAPPWWEGRESLARESPLSLLETRECKRMWRDTEQNVDQREFRTVVARSWCEERLTDDIEGAMARFIQIWTIRDVKAGMSADGPAMVAIADYLGEDANGLLNRLLLGASVPFLTGYRQTAEGLEKRSEWERVWDLQRAEDRGEKVPPFDPPPKYDQKDYRDSTTWRLRGKLDVPKERFISYPGCESDDDKEPVYGWAGWNHLQQAQALAALYQKRKTEESWGKERLTPMLAGLLELIPWVKQWHNVPSEEFGGLRLGDYFETFLDGECHMLGLTREELRAWRPPEKGRAKKAKQEASGGTEGIESAPAKSKRRTIKKEDSPEADQATVIEGNRR